MPALGELRARAAGEPTSSFDETDEERLMADRIWRFETSGHIADWAFDASAEAQRTRVGPPPGKRFSVDRYYNWLHRTPYQSAEVRYATLGADVEADVATLPDTFAAVCAVETIDRQRQSASANLQTAGQAADLTGRLAENDRQIASFLRAVRYRLDAYNYALDHLLVETPHPEARDVDGGLTALAAEVARAERGDFCARDDDPPHAGDPHPGPAIPSRFVHGNPAPSATPAAGS
jgi:hypothetical protein